MDTTGYNRYIEMMSQFGRKSSDLQTKSLLDNITSKHKFVSQMRKVRDLDIVGRIQKDLYDDSFSLEEDLFRMKFNPPNEQLKRTYGKRAQNLLDSLFEKLDIKSFISEHMNSFLECGEFFFTYEKKPKEGIVDIYDNIDQATTMCIGRQGKPVFLMEQKEGRIRILSARNKMIMTLGPSRVKYKIDDYNLFTPELQQRIPEYVISGKPLFYYVLPKLKTLKLTQAVEYVTEIRDILTPEIIMVGLPSNTDTSKIPQILETYEEYLKKSTIVPEMDISLEQMAASLSSPVALPSFSDARGSLSKPFNNESADKSQASFAKEEAIKESICLGTGYPFAYLKETGSDRTSTIRANGRYARLIKSIHYAIAKPMKKLALEHLECFGLRFEENAIDIKFKDTVDLDTLDEIEVNSIAISYLRDLVSLVKDVSDVNSNIEVNSSKLKDYLDDNLNLMPGFNSFFEISKNTAAPGASGAPSGDLLSDSDFSEEPPPEETRDNNEVNGEIEEGEG